MGRTLSLIILTDIESLFKTLLKSSTTSQQCLIINIRTARKVFRRDETTTIGRLGSKDSIASKLTKLARWVSLEAALGDETLIPKID